MANYDTEDFTGNIVSVVIAIIVVAAVAVPVIGQVTADMETGMVKTILDILPVFLVLAVLMMIVYIFITKKGRA